MSHDMPSRRNIKMNKTWLLSSGYVRPGSQAHLIPDSPGDDFQSQLLWTISRSAVRANTSWDTHHRPSAFPHLRLLTTVPGLEKMDSRPLRMLLLSRGCSIMGVSSRIGFSDRACWGAPGNLQAHLCTFESLIPEAELLGKFSHAELEFGTAL